MTYSFLKSFTSNFPPVKTSATFNQILAEKHKHAIIKKKRVWKWNPFKWLSGSDYLIVPASNGKIPNAKFWTTYIIPNPDPNKLGLTNIGTVGTITVQNIAIHTPNNPVGNHLSH